MTEPVVPYKVVYSERVRQRLRELGAGAFRRGDGAQFAAALREFHRLLSLYPQFGEPYRDMVAETGQFYIGTIRPLSMRYGFHEDRRLVMVGALPVLLPLRGEASADE